jgi:hypothetical protein
MRAWMMSGAAMLATSLTLMSGAAEAASTTLTRWGGWYGRSGGNTYRMGCAPGFVSVGLRVQTGYNYTHMQNAGAPGPTGARSSGMQPFRASS